MLLYFSVWSSPISPGLLRSLITVDGQNPAKPLDRVSFPSFLVAWKQWRWDHLKFEICRWSNHRQGLHLRQLGLKLHCSHSAPGRETPRENGPCCCQLCQTRWHEFQVLKQHHEELGKWNRIIHQLNQATETSKYPIPPINAVIGCHQFWPHHPSVKISPQGLGHYGGELDDPGRKCFWIGCEFIGEVLLGQRMTGETTLLSGKPQKMT